MPMPTILELAEAGAHYGHHRSLTYPKAKEFIYMTKNNVSLIDLEQTLHCLSQARQTLADYRANGRPVLFIGTKRSIRSIVKNIAESTGLPYMTERWYGGFLTNFPSFAAELKKMKELEEYLKSEKAGRLEKKERARYQSRLDHYNRFLGGVSNLSAMPELLIIASATEDKIALAEARKLGIPVIAIVDTDVNPDEIDYPIPANDDAPKAIEVILAALVEAPAKPTPSAKAETAAKPATKAVKTTSAKSSTKPAKAKRTAAKKATK
jgi:small subunit ribosomal protein S2